MQRFAIGICLLVCSISPVYAGDVELLEVVFTRQDNAWRIDTTLRHADTGWDHYADIWRVVTPDGTVLATRVLYHPHVHEQPFTRSLAEVIIPADMPIVYVEAHDKVHGWTQQRLRVDLRQRAGERFRVQRQ